MMIFKVSYSIQCKHGFFSSNRFNYSYPIVKSSWNEVEDDVFRFVNNFPWNKLQFESYSDPDIQLINDQPSNSDIIKVNQDFDRKFIPEARRMHKKNGTLRNDNNGSGSIPKPVKFAAGAYAGYKAGKWLT